MATGGQMNTDILSDEIFDVLCSMCKHEGKNSEGAKFCVDCSDYFCINCVKVHSKVPVLVGHKVVDKSQVKSATSRGLPRAPAERCDKHSHKHIDMYCQNHDTVGCSTCIAVDHKSCKDTFYIPEYIKNCGQNVHPKEMQTKLTTIAKTIADQVEQCKQDRQILQKRKAEILAEIKKFRQEINDQLDRLEKCSVDEIEGKFKLLERKIEDEMKQLQANKARISSANEKLASPNPNPAEEFVYIKMGEDAENDANMCVKASKMKSLADVEFHPDRKLLQQLDISSTLGIITEKNIKPDSKLFKITGKQSYSIKDKSDANPCDIISGCYMDDGTIILADYSNKRLKRLDRHSYTVTDYCDLPECPWQVCTIDKTQVAVSTSSQQEVHFISVGRQMKTKQKIQTDFDCYSLAYANNNLYISDHYTSVYIYTLYGKKLKQFKNQLFSDINCLAVSKDATRIYVAHYYNGLVVLDNNGQVVTTFNGKQLQMANHCYLTEAGSVLVAGGSSNNVLQFTSNGEMIGEVIKADQGKKYLQSVCCNQQMSKLLITTSNEDDIEVYDM